ncbi:MAG: hypothetical protein D4R63_09965 [Methylococcaceae bacterium]|nr:MAG: hypothetical protein D4R63_09965 [Methylococcaceae bacterium]
MINSAKNYPPNIISFKQSLNGIKVASKQDIIVPCHAFKVSIPARSKHGLNIFEETILKLSAIETSDTIKLAELTCLAEEIVKFIQNRLFQLDFLSSRFEPTQQAKYLLEQLDNEPQEYIAATVYVDLLSGTVLPMVVSNAPKYETVNKYYQQTVVFELGNSSKNDTIKSQQLKQNSLHMAKMITSDDVSKTIKAFKQLNKRFSLLNNSKSTHPDYYPITTAITVSPQPQLVFLHCQVILQQGSSDLLVTDPFGYGFSAILKESLDKMDEDWLLNIKKKAINETVGLNSSSQSSSKLPEFSDSINQYPEIRNFLVNAEKKLRKAKQPIDTSNKEKKFQESVGDAIKSFYDALEWSFRQVVFEYPVEQWENLLSNQSSEANGKVLLKLAEKIGFEISSKSNFLLKLMPTKINSFRNGIVEMQPLLALAIAGASQDNRHPIFRLASKNPTVLSFIAELKSWRDPVAHGHGDELDYRKIMQVTSYRCLKCKTVYRVTEKPSECSNCSSEEINADTTLLDDYKNQTYNIIKSLFPSLISVGNTVNNAENIIIDDIDQLILKADIALDEFFGMNEMRLMPSKLREQLKNIELKINEEGGSSEVINSLSSALEISLFCAISMHKSGNEITEQLKNVALNKAIESNFELVDKAFPESIRTVKNDRVRQAINGTSATLGANCLTLLIIMPTDVLNKISGYKPNLLIFISELINIRGHGNNFQQQISKNELLELKKQSYQIIKLLMDLNNG